MTHLEEEWFKLAKKASDLQKRGQIFAFGIRAIKEEAAAFHKDNLHQIPIYHRKYQTNPFQYQYDLMVHIYLNYYRILTREIQILKKEHNPKAEELEFTQTLYGINREDFFFGAAELRWPTDKVGKEFRGRVIRDPWANERIQALSDKDYKYVINFGGGGQGKTSTFSAFQVMVWDHFIFTERGARCTFSTVGKDKINLAVWPYIQNLVTDTPKDISLYAGQGIVGGDWMIRRPQEFGSKKITKDTAGVIKGVLISNEKSDKVVDKLTGSHGHHYVCYLIDEMQSTPLAPINASSNYTLRCGDYRIIGAGNYGEDTDSLGQNVQPENGWDTVNENTGRWISNTTNHQKAIVLHFSNQRSPGMTPEGEKQFTYLPNRNVLRKNFPTPESQDIKNKQFRRFWMGWRLEDADSDKVLTDSMVRQNNAHLPLELRRITHEFLSFDSAQAEGDRNIIADFQEGIDLQTNERVWGLFELKQTRKTEESLSYYMRSTDEIMEVINRRKIQSGAMILDFTGRPAHAEILKQRGFQTVRLIYNMAVQDGKRVHPETKRVERPIIIDPNQKLYAHQIAGNSISLGAYLLQEYVKSGRVRGINKEMLKYLDGNVKLEDEMYARKFEMKVSAQYGELIQLVSKKEFKEIYGFSPDVLDVWFQAAYYMFTVRGFPISPISGNQDHIPDASEYFDHNSAHLIYKQSNPLDYPEEDDGYNGIYDLLEEPNF